VDPRPRVGDRPRHGKFAEESIFEEEPEAPRHHAPGERADTKDQPEAIPLNEARRLLDSFPGVTYVSAVYYGSRLFAREPPTFAGVAQLVRAPACHAGGRGFEPLHSRQSFQWLGSFDILFFQLA
jgi:hypothetical protein